MSRITRQRRQTQTDMSSPQIFNTNDRIIEAKNNIDSPDLFIQSTDYIQAAWQKLRQAYEATASESQECQPFPFWALKQFKHNHVEKVIRFGYPEDIGLLKTYAASAPDYFKADPWKFILFFNHIEQGRARKLNDVMKAREPFKFKQLYKEVCRHRSSRMQGRTNIKSEFLPADFKACCKESTSIEDNSELESDIEIIDSLDDEEEDEINGEDTDGESEPAVFSPPNPDLDHGIGHTFGQDAHMIGDQNSEETGCLDDNSTRLNISNSYNLIQDDAESLDEASTTDVTNQVEQEARRHDTSPEQPSAPNLDPNNGSTSNIKERYFQALQDGPPTTILLELEELKAKGEAEEKNIETFKEKNRANKEQLQQVLPSGPWERIVSLCSDIATQDGKRKMEEECKRDTDRKKAKLVAQLNATILANSNQFATQHYTNVQRHEATSE